MKRQTFNRLIAAANFPELFITEMGWNNPTGSVKLPPIEIDSVTYCPQVMADKSGFKVLVCEVDTIPTTSVCRRIDLKVRRFANDYILIIVKRIGFHHLWLAPVHKVDKRDVVTTDYTNAGQAEFLFQKVDNLSFAFDERVTITDVRQRVQESFVVNSEKVTKDFYAGFRKEHKAFVEFISGIEGTDTAIKDRQWYASVMLNRLMFCYFIQKKGFFDGKNDYLQEKLRLVQRERGEGHFFRSFYIGFLRGLFHDGLNTPRHDEEFESTYGRIPYLNGGMFDEHKIEHDYADINIADEAFERLFNFFDRWNWHLDTRITASGRDINPDVLGYIFEQYINDRAQMGAYYTKEDITEYIGRNCILPYLFDAVKGSTAGAAKDFEPDGYVWRTLRESGDRYIFDAVKHGADIFDRIPAEIRRGIITDDMRHEYAETPVGELPANHIPLSELRKDWNRPTPEAWGLPTEIWRESIERITRGIDIKAKITTGEISSINDFITYNLDIRLFAHDLLEHAADHLFIKHFYEALQKVTILDPTCGSGAFLFAAMNILEPLYEICIERMQEFNRVNPALFKKELEEISNKYRSNIQYFIYKSIILRNLYGVDIMVEATEIAKLRLFLKMVAVVDVDRRADNLGLDPLPDIDFNIRCGNTLVGYATEQQLNDDLSDSHGSLEEMVANEDFKEKIELEMQKVAAAYDIFVRLQLTQEDNMLEFKQAKQDLNKRLAFLNEQLNRKQFAVTGQSDYSEWLKSHQPFNWLAEFYQIIHGNGGFDVIIGNPPYVTFTDKSLPYRVHIYKTYTTKNLFALCAERFVSIISSKGSVGYIIPLSGLSIEGFAPLQKIIYKNYTSWNSYYSGDRNPSELFTGVKIRAAIYLGRPSQNEFKFVSRYIKYQSAERPILFTKISYTRCFNCISAPKIPSVIGKRVISKIDLAPKQLRDYFSGTDYIFYHAAPIHWGKSLSNLNKLHQLRLNVADSYKKLIVNGKARDFAFILLNSTLFFYYWIIYSDCYNLTKKYFNIHIPEIEDVNFSILAKSFDSALWLNMKEAEYTYKNRGIVRFAQFFPKQSKSIIDEIDKELAKYYGFTDEELDFITNYDIKYRMGDELNNDE